jgi:precorrin isomerase
MAGCSSMRLSLKSEGYDSAILLGNAPSALA